MRSSAGCRYSAVISLYSERTGTKRGPLTVVCAANYTTTGFYTNTCWYYLLYDTLGVTCTCMHFINNISRTSAVSLYEVFLHVLLLRSIHVYVIRGTW